MDPCYTIAVCNQNTLVRMWPYANGTFLSNTKLNLSVVWGVDHIDTVIKQMY